MRRISTLVCVLAACGGGDNAGTGPSNLTIAAQAGGDQTGAAAAPLPTQLAVVVTSNGAPVPARTVNWAVTGGGGGVDPASAVTDANGIATTAWRLGSAGGGQQVDATLVGGSSTGSPVRFSATATATLPAAPLVATVEVPPNYGAHDTFVRDGVAFLCAWNTGLIILDVGGGGHGGSPASPVELSRIVPSADGIAGGAQVHNAWWFHNPSTSEKRYVFTGQEALGLVGASSAGDIHVLDVSDLTAPSEVAFFHLGDISGITTGTHNFWLDEPAQILYAAYYNGGVIALDVSGTLSGDLGPRLIANVQPGGPSNTYVWGVQLYNGDLYATDMLSGIWRLKLDRAAGTFSVVGGGNNVPERFSSDLWVAGGYAYTGTWGSLPRQRGINGNVIKVWQLSASGAPALANQVAIAGAGNVGDDQVSDDGRYLVAVTERGTDASKGLYIYRLTDPARPSLVAFSNVPGIQTAGGGLHTGTFATIAGRRYVFAARNPSPVGGPPPALLIFDVTDLTP